MSWPSDGEPRYVVGSIEGGDIGAGGNGRKVYVYDRGYCHRIVATEACGHHRQELAHQRAQELCNRLNERED